MRPTLPQPRRSQAPLVFSLALLFQSPSLLETPHEWAFLLLPPAKLADPGPLPQDAQTSSYRRTRPPQHPTKGRPLSLPLGVESTTPARPKYPPPLLMARTYKALKVRSRLLMLDEWDSLHPPPEYYTYHRRLDPHPFMGLDNFIAGRLHQMRAHKSYLAAHPS